MTTYEILLMLDPEQADARQDEILARARDLVEKNGGAWHSHDAWGRRRLAYPIAHKEEGVYHLVVFDAEAATLDEVSRVLKIDDAVLRHLATRHIAGSRTSAPRDEAAAPWRRRPNRRHLKRRRPEAAAPAAAAPETTFRKRRRAGVRCPGRGGCPGRAARRGRGVRHGAISIASFSSAT